MNPTSEILERVNKSSSEHHDGVFTRLFRYLLRRGHLFCSLPEIICKQWSNDSRK